MREKGALNEIMYSNSKGLKQFNIRDVLYFSLEPENDVPVPRCPQLNR